MDSIPQQHANVYGPNYFVVFKITELFNNLKELNLVF